MRSRTRLPAVVGTILIAAPVVNGVSIAPARADVDCLPAPSGPSPQGSHWRYHVERGTGRQCWYLHFPSEGAKSEPRAMAPNAMPVKTVAPGAMPSGSIAPNAAAPKRAAPKPAARKTATEPAAILLQMPVAPAPMPQAQSDPVDPVTTQAVIVPARPPDPPPSAPRDGTSPPGNAAPAELSAPERANPEPPNEAVDDDAQLTTSSITFSRRPPDADTAPAAFAADPDQTLVFVTALALLVFGGGGFVTWRSTRRRAQRALRAYKELVRSRAMT
jgi:hypothetical protein